MIFFYSLLFFALKQLSENNVVVGYIMKPSREEDFAKVRTFSLLVLNNKNAFTQNSTEIITGLRRNNWILKK